MKLNKINEVKDFTACIQQCQSDVWLESIYGDRYNLKSPLSRYIAIGKLLESNAQDLELFCANKEDENIFFKFFADNPSTLAGK